jgi:hypothetical protein
MHQEVADAFQLSQSRFSSQRIKWNVGITRHVSKIHKTDSLVGFPTRAVVDCTCSTIPILLEHLHGPRKEQVILAVSMARTNGETKMTWGSKVLAAIAD